MKNLALFDFDHTITTNDNFTQFIYFSVPATRLYIGKVVLAPMLVAYKIRVLPGTVLRQLVARFVFYGRSALELQALGAAYARDELPKFIRPNAWDRIQWHKDNGDDVVIVSASLDLYLKDWCLHHGLRLISSELEFTDGRCKGRYNGADCSGQEKARRIRKTYNLREYALIYAYGDSIEDEAMLSLAHRKFFRWQERT